MNKAELVSAVAKKSDIAKGYAGEVVNAVFDVIAGSLAKDEKVQIVGFGTFDVRDRGARTGRNPQTGEEIQIAATRVAGFKPGKELKGRIS